MLTCNPAIFDFYRRSGAPRKLLGFQDWDSYSSHLTSIAGSQLRSQWIKTPSIGKNKPQDDDNKMVKSITGAEVFFGNRQKRNVIRGGHDLTPVKFKFTHKI
jgi:hypothetical protein